MILLHNTSCINILTTHIIRVFWFIVQENIAAVVFVCSFEKFIPIHKYRNKCDFRFLKNLVGML